MVDTNLSLQDVHFVRITPDTVLEICALSETLNEKQRTFVADNAISIA